MKNKSEGKSPAQVNKQKLFNASIQKTCSKIKEEKKINFNQKTMQ